MFWTTDFMDFYTSLTFDDVAERVAAAAAAFEARVKDHQAEANPSYGGNDGTLRLLFFPARRTPGHGGLLTQESWYDHPSGPTRRVVRVYRDRSGKRFDTELAAPSLSQELFNRVWDAACARTGFTAREPLDYRALAQFLADRYGAEYKEYQRDPSTVYVRKEDHETGNGWQIAVFSDLRWWVNQITNGEPTRIAEGQVKATASKEAAWSDLWVRVPDQFFRQGAT